MSAPMKNARREAPRPGVGVMQWSALYEPRQFTKSRGRFVRERLPAPLTYFAGAGVELRGRGVWRDAVCVFHADSRPSLRVNVESGAYRCMSCGAAGRDVLAFHQRRHGLGFIEAAQALGAWEVGQ